MRKIKNSFDVSKFKKYCYCKFDKKSICPCIHTSVLHLGHTSLTHILHGYHKTHRKFEQNYAKNNWIKIKIINTLMKLLITKQFCTHNYFPSLTPHPQTNEYPLRVCISNSSHPDLEHCFGKSALTQLTWTIKLFIWLNFKLFFQLNSKQFKNHICTDTEFTNDLITHSCTKRRRFT